MNDCKIYDLEIQLAFSNQTYLSPMIFDGGLSTDQDYEWDFIDQIFPDDNSWFADWSDSLTENQ